MACRPHSRASKAVKRSPKKPGGASPSLAGLLSIIYYITLYHIISYYIILYCITLHYITLHYITLYCIVLYCIVLYCIVLYCIVLYCIVLYCIVLYCILLFSKCLKRSYDSSSSTRLLRSKWPPPGQPKDALKKAARPYLSWPPHSANP